jgi:hypothetical protein
MSNKDTYLKDLRAWEGKPIVGTHTIGDLTIVCSDRNWTMTDTHGNTYRGGKSDMRYAIKRAVLKHIRAI